MEKNDKITPGKYKKEKIRTMKEIEKSYKTGT